MWMNPSGICSQKCTRLFSPASAFSAAFRRAPCQRCQDQKFSAELIEIGRDCRCGSNRHTPAFLLKHKIRSQRDISLNKTEKTRKLKDLSISENGTQRSSNQDEIIALLKRIQVSISRGQSTSSRRTNQNISRQKKPAKSLLRTLRRHPRKKQTKAQSLEEIKGSPQSSNTLKDESSRGSGSSRPLSRFVKKSPIPQLSSKENTKKAVEEKASETDVVLELQKLEGLKLIELKELAKAKGVNGFSKLKKRELLELLKEVWKSSS